MTAGGLRIALLSYRAHPEVGGQGVYVRNLSDALTGLGHRVTVFAGQPYPDLSDEVELHEVPSLDLYRPDDPFRRPALREFRGPIDYLEYAQMTIGAFPEPLTFSLRAARALDPRSFDVVHDNQGLGYGLLALKRRVPLVATIHHPISVDRRVALAAAPRALTRLGKRRWYSFVRMQARVARALPVLLAVSESARDETMRDFGVPAGSISVVHNGVDADLYRPLDHIERTPGRIIAIASSDQPTKGLEPLVEAVAKLSTEREVELVVVGRGGEGACFRRAVERFGVADRVEALGRVDALTLVDELNKASVGVVPSLYEGFSLPAVEMLACGVPLVASRGGALPEVVGDAGLLVPPGDAQALAGAIARVLDDAGLAATCARVGRERVLERFTWRNSALATVELYRKAIAAC